MARRTYVSFALLLSMCALLLLRASRSEDVCPSLPDDLRLHQEGNANGSNLVSIGGDYMEINRHYSDLDCDYVIVFDCRQGKQLAQLGCVGDFAPADSRYAVKAVRWLSNTALRIGYFNGPNTEWRETNIFMDDPMSFDIVMPYLSWNDD